MGDEVTQARVIVEVSVDSTGSLRFQVNTHSPIELWGLAKQLEKFADELAFQQQSQAMAKKARPRILTP
jgi:hypothetical protein